MRRIKDGEQAYPFLKSDTIRLKRVRSKNSSICGAPSATYEFSPYHRGEVARSYDHN